MKKIGLKIERLDQRRLLVYRTDVGGLHPGLIRRLHRDSKYTIVLIEHDMRVVFHLADHISVLAEGRLLAEGTPAEIGANEHVQNAYLGKAE